MSSLGRLRNAAGWLNDPPALRRRATADGYLYLPGLVPVEPVLALRRRVLETCVDLGWLMPGGDTVRPGATVGDPADPVFLELQRRVLPSPEFRALGLAPGLQAALTALYGHPPYGGHGDVCRVGFPGGYTTPPHQDHAYIGGATDLWTAWLPLGDCPLELGPLAVSPGSCRAGPLPHGADYRVPNCEQCDWAAGDLGCGDVLLFHCLTLHRACSNRSAGRLRLSVDYRFRSGQSAAPA